MNYLNRIKAEPRSLRTAVVKEEHSSGYWRDTHIITFSKTGNVTVRPDNNPLYLPTDVEAGSIQSDFSDIEWPEAVFIESEYDPKLPAVWFKAEEKDRFVFRNTEGKIIMLQLRQDKNDGKKYFPITLWSDGEYRFAEPDGKLPLYGLDTLKDNQTVLIVEGAKTARYVDWLVKGATPEALQARNEHPWGDQLQHIAVVGWSSGALSPQRTDWEPLRKAGITRAYVSLDNDSVGRAALPDIAQQLRCVTIAIDFSEEWPASADLYDPFPEIFFKEIEGKKFYIGPSFADCCYPATWMTDLVEIVDDKKSKMVPVLRSHARNLYQWIEETGTFCYLEMPDINWSADTLDNALRPFSHTKKVSELLLANFNGRITSFDYSPATKKRKIIVNGKPVINLYTPPSLKPQEGNPKPWLEFMEQLLPNESERRQMLRWIATLIAKPEIRMIWSPLLISNQTGTGKSTLGQIAAELVGRHNASFPSEQVMAGEFNAWIAKKRLIVVNEIYAGASWKTFNKLKDLITEPVITMRQMYRDPVDISNWAQFLMFSNSFAALKIDAQDRRIFVPEVTETRWSDDKWIHFHSWLQSGGYSIIAHWALNFGDYVKHGERAPDSERKHEIIESSQSRAQQKVEELSAVALESDEPIVISLAHSIEWIETMTKSKVFETPLQVRKMFSSCGMVDAKEIGVKNRISYKSQLTYFLLNKKAVDLVAQLSDTNDIVRVLKENVKLPNELIQNGDDVL